MPSLTLTEYQPTLKELSDYKNNSKKFPKYLITIQRGTIPFDFYAFSEAQLIKFLREYSKNNSSSQVDMRLKASDLQKILDKLK